jgi:hypothetical protein
MKDISDTLSVNELKDLEDLVASPGFRLLETMVDREWGPQGFGEKITATLGKIADQHDGIASQQLLQAVVTQREILRVMKWPRESLAKAKHLAIGRVASMNRGGL